MYSNEAKGLAFIMSRPHSARGLGHVAWGYTYKDIFVFGSVENSKGLSIASPARMEYWEESASIAGLEEVLNDIRDLGYTRYKATPVINPNARKARETSLRQSVRPYWVIGNNCLDSVHKVLSAYGAENLSSRSNPLTWIPNAWFDSLPFECIALSPKVRKNNIYELPFHNVLTPHPRPN